MVEEEDYKHCDGCRTRLFHDVELDLYNIGSWVVLCNECALSAMRLNWDVK